MIYLNVYFKTRETHNISSSTNIWKMIPSIIWDSILHIFIVFSENYSLSYLCHTLSYVLISLNHILYFTFTIIIFYSPFLWIILKFLEIIILYPDTINAHQNEWIHQREFYTWWDFDPWIITRVVIVYNTNQILYEQIAYHNRLIQVFGS